MLWRGSQALRRFSTGQVSPARASFLAVTRGCFPDPGAGGPVGWAGGGHGVETWLKAKTAFLKLGDCREGSGEGLG